MNEFGNGNTESLNATICGTLQLRTESAANARCGVSYRHNGGRLAQPLRWYKSLEEKNITEETFMSDFIRHYFLDRWPGYLAGLINVLPKSSISSKSSQPKQSRQSEQPKQANQHTVGIFDDIDNPACAGFINVPNKQNKQNKKIPTTSRDFACTFTCN